MTSIRLARHCEARAIALMSRDLIEVGLGWSWGPQRVLASIQDPDTNVIVAPDEGRVVGFALMQYLEEEAHLLLLAVRHAYRRRGIARALVDWLEQTALVAGIGVIHLEVRERNAEARRFYRALGFVDGRTVRGYYRGMEAAVRMSRRLRVAVDTPTSRTGRGGDGRAPHDRGGWDRERG